MYTMLSYLISTTGAVSGSAPVHSEQWTQMNRYMYTCDHTSTIKHFLYSSKTQFPIVFPIHVYNIVLLVYVIYCAQELAIYALFTLAVNNALLIHN